MIFQENIHVPLLQQAIAYWDFDRTFISRGTHPLTLRILRETVNWCKPGVWSPHALHITAGAQLHIPRAELGPLNCCGPQAQVTLFAWIRPESDAPWQHIAGVWNETAKQRQFGLFFNATTRTNANTMQRIPCRMRVHGHLSHIGGTAPGNICCLTYASGGTEISTHTWTPVAMTYDGEAIRVYVQGRLDPCTASNPFPYPGGIFDSGPDGADFTVGANHAGGETRNFFAGALGGLAIFPRALSPNEIAALSTPPLQEHDDSNSRYPNG